MKIAFAHWDNRIAPVFDTTRQIYVIETESERIVRETQESLDESLPIRKVLQLVELGVGTLVCGAISRAMYEMVIAYGIQVIPFIAGDLNEVIRGCLSGKLESDTFAMPGCGRGKGRGFRSFQDNREEENNMSQTGRGMGAGGGRGQGQGARKPGRAGRMGGPKAAGPTGCCICPQCGQKEPHQRGVPCAQRKCSKCGTIMTRE